MMNAYRNLTKPDIETRTNSISPSYPWFKFFPSDWRGDAALRMCSLAARGLWIEMLCVMHEAKPRGTMRINSRAVSDSQLANLVGGTLDTIAPLLEELEAAGALSRDQNGCIFSRRMVRDQANSIRNKANGAKGGNPSLKRSVKLRVNPPSNPQIPDSTYQTSSLRSEELSIRDHFNEFWRSYPNKVGKAAALRSFEAALRRVGWSTLLVGLERYVAKTDDRPWCNPKTWLDQDRWGDEPAEASPMRGRKSPNAVSLLMGPTLEAYDVDA